MCLIVTDQSCKIEIVTICNRIFPNRKTVIIIILFAYKEEPEDETERLVGIHIKGKVNAPGYYELEFGSRVKDAVLAAGSETENADLESLNLAMILSDGEEITIPSLKGEKTAESDVVNINTADLYHLCKLKGIGNATAAEIIKYRTQKGAFKTVKELMKVPGIGKSKFDEIKDEITV